MIISPPAIFESTVSAARVIPNVNIERIATSELVLIPIDEANIIEALIYNMIEIILEI